MFIRSQALIATIFYVNESAFCVTMVTVFNNTDTSKIDTTATPELLLERNIKLAEKLFTQNKVPIFVVC